MLKRVKWFVIVISRSKLEMWLIFFLIIWINLIKVVFKPFKYYLGVFISKKTENIYILLYLKTKALNVYYILKAQNNYVWQLLTLEI